MWCQESREFSKAYPVDVAYTMQVQDYGWLAAVKNGAIGGTIGKAKRMETMSISIQNIIDKDSDLGISYNAHVQDIGWQGKTNDVSTWKRMERMPEQSECPRDWKHFRFS